ncbi:MAG: ATP-dependent helicase [Desulfobacteraceae bacterium]|nr:MAG: ATP-dependent helicase [Desulfobacteraceae bacterium]
MSELNPEQRAAAEFLEGVAAVIAVPGSGKTLTMMERIGMLVKKHGIAPESILGLTFTRNAADEMRSRLVPVLGELASRVTLSTIHSFCYFVLRWEGRTFEILSGKDQMIFVRDLMKKMKVKDLSIGLVLSEISLAKNNLISVDEFKEIYAGDKTMLKVGEIYEAYDREKEKKLLLDFDDLLVEVHKILSNGKGVREKYRDIYKHLLIDEFQDTNPAQMEILKLLINPDNGSSFFAVGDDWQSIYGFTGASVGNILNFQSMFPQGVQFILNLNYRSSPQILRACQNLIQHNTRKIEKTLETHNPDGEDVVVLESSSEESEALNIVTEIKDLVEGRGYAYKEIGVLYRCNFQSRVLEEVFSQHKIPYHVQNGLSFYHRKEIANLLDYLRVISNPMSEDGDFALSRILNVPNRYVGKKFLRDLSAFAEKRGIRLYEALKEMPLEPIYVRKNLKEFNAFMDPLIEDSENLQPADTIHLLRSALDYDRYVTDEDVPTPDDQKIQNLDQLQLSAVRFKNIRSFLEYTESFEDEMVSDNKEGVHLMTVHKAKGLEFPAVFVVGLVEGILPSKKGDIEEERRICFVAMSRAMYHLYLSHSLTYLGQPAKKSIFIDEALALNISREPANTRQIS